MVNPSSSWLELLHPAMRLGRTRYALFDFDGTLSLIRRGWERIMIALMVESIGAGGAPPQGVEQAVAEYVDRSTGILTIRQMQWLEQEVRRYGLSSHPLSASQYKKIYNERLLQPVRARLSEMKAEAEAADEWMVAGAREFLSRLAGRGVRLFLASGTDQEYVRAEAAALEISGFFDGQIYGAQGDSLEDSKENVIERILGENGLSGEELLVVGDGPVEIRYARRVGAVALGVAADEATRQAPDPRKRSRLLEAGADLLIFDFTHSAELVELFCGGKQR